MKGRSDRSRANRCLGDIDDAATPSNAIHIAGERATTLLHAQPMARCVIDSNAGWESTPTIDALMLQR